MRVPNNPIAMLLKYLGVCLMLSGIIFSAHTFAQVDKNNMSAEDKISTKGFKKAIGWHWYNEIRPETKKDKNDMSRRNSEAKNNSSATFKMDLLRKNVREAKAQAILYPTEENMRFYLILQNFVMNKAALFTKMWKRVLLSYPELDYNILHPTQSSAQQILNDQIKKKEDEAIKSFGEKYGLFFFYRGENELDVTLAPTIDSFSKDSNISLVSISVDGTKLDIFSDGHIDSGQADKLGVKHFPALILVDSKNQRVRPISYGFISSTELRRRFLQVATDFQEGV